MLSCFLLAVSLSGDSGSGVNVDELTKSIIRQLSQQGNAIIGISQELKNIGKPTKKTPRLGSQQTLPEPPAGSAFTAVGQGYSSDFVGESVRLITTEGDEFSQEPGSYILVVNSKPLIVGPTGPSIRRGTNLLAKITFGSGGVTHLLEVDGNQGSIALPAQTLFVEIGEIPYCQIDQAGSIGPNNYYQSTLVSATVQKSSNSTARKTTRSYWTLGDATDVMEIPIPPFAYEWTVMPFAEVTSGSLPIASAYVENAFNEVLDTPIPEMLESMARTHCFRALPPNVQGGKIVMMNTNASWAGQLVFHVGI